MSLRFPGQYTDSETGLFYNFFRSYMPNQGRYTQADPIGLAGGSNRFAYVSANPLGASDPFGLLEHFNFEVSSGTLSSDCSCMNGSVSAFSGNGSNRNNSSSSHIPDSGPIPPGRYLIVDPYIYTRDPTHPLSNLTFFKLYRDDGRYADNALVPNPTSLGESVLRGQFRVHPGTASNGCVTLSNINAWKKIQHQLLNRTKIEFLPNGMPYFGTVNVK
jgi:RHS repeat-associated protein